MNRLLTAVLLILTLIFVISCTPTSVTDYSSFVQFLKKSGATVEPKGATEQIAFPEFFTGTEKLVKLNGENLNIWEYSNEATASTETHFIKFDGFNLTKPSDSAAKTFASHVDWQKPPHWYSTGRIIVLYVGENQEILALLENLLGPYFAGPSRIPPPATDYDTLIDNLLWLGDSVIVRGDSAFPGDDLQPHVFSGSGKRVQIQSENISVLVYEDEITAAAETEFISKDGYMYTSGDGRMTVNISWIAPPHFYQKGRIIVLYVGTNQSIIDLLEDLLGKQFSGG